MTCISSRIISLCFRYIPKPPLLTQYSFYYNRFKRSMPPETEAHIRVLEDGNFNFIFPFHEKKSDTNRLCLFQRKLEEPLDKLLQRISMKINDTGCKKKKKKKEKELGVSSENANIPVPIELIKDGVSVPGDIICSELFNENESEKLFLKIGDYQYNIFFNHPWVNYVILPATIMAGFPIYPYKLELLYSDVEESEFSWSKISGLKPDQSEAIGSGFIYSPNTQDIGSYLKLTCIPKRDNIIGDSITAFSDSVVEAGPGLCPFEVRHSFTKDTLKDDSFRVISYNILADLYASSDTGKTSIFGYCPSYALKINYRKLLLLKELIGYNADLICLQEVDLKVFMRDLKPVLESVGFEGVLTKKGGQVNEGVACFYRKNRFKLVSNHSLILGEQSQTDQSLKELWEVVQQNENLYARAKDKNTVVQILVFEYLDKPNHKLIVGNTHLYFHPEADHVRMLQAGICLNVMNDIRNKIKSEEPDCTLSVVFAGDFNSTPECGVYELFTTNYISEDHREWKSDPAIEENKPGLEFHNDINFQSACGIPEFTNYTPDFSGCLDYIFYETDNLQVEQVVPFPDKDEVVLHIAIPSIVFPSDHLALVADLRWKKLS